jgi:hypothetical protein
VRNAPLHEVHCPVSDSAECGDIRAIDPLNVGEDYLVRNILRPEEVNRGPYLEGHFGT